MIPRDTIEKLAMCFASLSELGQQLSEAQWKLPTECPGWTVQDNLSHIVAFERVLNGHPATSHQAQGFDYIRNPIGASNENEIDARRHLSGAEVLAEWNQTAAERLATLRSADEAYYSTEMSTPTGLGTIADLLHIRVLDCWVHEQDMRSALGVPGGRDSKAVDVGIGFFLNLIEVSDPPLFNELTSTSVSQWDILRSLTGRRTVEQMNSIGLNGEAIALHFPGSPFSLPKEAVE